MVDEIRIDITDWKEEALEEEMDMSSIAMAIESRITHNCHPAKAARIYIVSRELGAADPEMLPANKTLLMIGGAHQWSQMEAKQFEEVVLKNGKTIRVRHLVASAAESELEEGDTVEEEILLETEPYRAPVTWDDPSATGMAVNYLMGKAVGHVYSRLKIIAANEGDVRSAWNMFCDKVEALVVGLQ